VGDFSFRYAAFEMTGIYGLSEGEASGEAAALFPLVLLIYGVIPTNGRNLLQTEFSNTIFNYSRIIFYQVDCQQI
jgi:hypothetical protein